MVAAGNYGVDDGYNDNPYVISNNGEIRRLKTGGTVLSVMEEFPYEDKGCELFPSCLNCPFPDCLKEQPWGKERFLKRRRAQRMLELRREGKSIREIARIFEVSPRTVQRWLKAVEAVAPN